MRCVCEQIDEAEWMHVNALSTDMMQQYPPAHDGEWVVTDPCVSMPAAEISWGPHESACVPSENMCGIVAALNAQSLRDGRPEPQGKHEGMRLAGKASLIMEQMHQRGVVTVGVQEARSSGPCTMTAEHYVRVCSGCEDAVYCCELWFARHVTTRAGRKLTLTAKSVNIVVARPRTLVVRISQAWIDLYCVVLHAPHRKHPKQLIDSWRECASNDMHEHVPSHADVILRVDANGALGSVRSAAVGERGAHAESVTGRAFRSFLLEHRLRVPSTFSEFQRDRPGHTHISQDGAHHRIDVIALRMNRVCCSCVYLHR